MFVRHHRLCDSILAYEPWNARKVSEAKSFGAGFAESVRKVSW
jgi:hypothetical protein